MANLGVVNLKLASTEWLFCNLVILIRLYKIPYKNLDKALLFLRNQVIRLKNWELWRAPTTIKFNIFCWNFAHVSYLTMPTKGCLGFFKILFRSRVINKNVMNESVETGSFLFLQITHDLKKNLKTPNTPL